MNTALNTALILNENLFLIILGLIFITGAVLQDLRRREVDNIWNFSLIGFALAYRAIVSVSSGNYWFLFNGIIGWAVFILLGNLFYYGRLFAGGDAKLIMSLGTILPLSYDWIVNFKIFGLFVLLFMVCGSIYAIVWSLFLVVSNFRKFAIEFAKQWKIYRRIAYLAFTFSVLWAIFSVYVQRIELVFIALVVFIFPLLFVFAKSVEESCMVVKVKWNNITVGDWLYKDSIVNGKKIKAHFEGLSNENVSHIKKHKATVFIKYGIPFTPAFLLAFIVLLLFILYGIFI
jgi:hypothetical protein